MGSRLLSVTDVVERILDEIHYQQDSESLLRIGLAGRVLLAPALDRIWEDAPFFYLAQLMPTHAWTLRVDSDDEWGPKITKTIEMGNVAQNEDWIGDRLPLYSQRIRKLCWSGSGSRRGERHVLGDSLCMTWAMHLTKARSSLFPNIHQVNVEGEVLASKPMTALILALVPPRLGSLSLFMSGEEGGQGYAEFLELLASSRRHPQLGEIRITWHKLSHLPSDVRSASLSHLRGVISKGILRDIFTDEGFSVFAPTSAYLSHLTYIRARLTSQETKWVKSSSGQLLPSLQFADLSGTLGDIIKVVSWITSKHISHLEIRATGQPTLDSELLTALAQALSEHPSRDALKDVYVSPAIRQNSSRPVNWDSAQFQDIFAPLTNLRSLRHLRLDPILFRPDVKTIMNFAALCSSLRHSHGHIVFPLVPFFVYVEACPLFRHWDALPLALNLGDPDILTSHHDKRPQFSAFRYLYVGGKPKMEDIPTLGDMIVDTFPSLAETPYTPDMNGPMKILLTSISARIRSRGLRL